MDFFGIVNLGQNEIVSILLLFFIFLYIIRLITLKGIFYIFKNEYSFYFSKFNNERLTFFHFWSSGKIFLFSTKLILDSEYNLDDTLTKKRYFYIFYTFFYYITLVLIGYMLYSIYFLV
jgi:hypothetical protein